MNLHVLWVNEAADFVGGCEQYIYNTVGLLRDRGVRSTLLYDPTRPHASVEMLRAFDAAFPMVDIPRQVAAIAPDVIYVHRLSGWRQAGVVTSLGLPVARFFHDHTLFCLREHKYRPLTHRTCKDPIGLRCYLCLGFINRRATKLGFGLATLSAARRELRANKCFSAFVVASRYMADQVAAHGFDRGRIHVLPLYAPCVSDSLPVRRQPDILLFVGQLVRGKGLDILLKALPLLSHPARLVVVGAGRQEALFRQQCLELGLDGRVTFAGSASAEQLAVFYRTAACVILPSRAPETFGLVGPEAMRHGTPVVASDVGGIGQWLEHEKTGIAVPPNDKHALAAAIDRILGEPGLAERLGEHARVRYEEHFRPERHIESLLALFDSLRQERQ